MKDDAFLKMFADLNAMLRDARPDQVAEALRLVACEVAFCARYRERPSLDEFVARITAAGEDEAAMAVVVDGLAHLREVLELLHVPAPLGTQEGGGNGVNWFDAGGAAYQRGAREGARFPPLNDMEAQRAWLGGFGAAWAEDPGDEPVDEALARVCKGRERLLVQLRSHRAGWGSATVQ